MAVLTRTRVGYTPKGYARRLSSTLGGWDFVSTSDSITDTRSPGDGHYLSISHKKLRGGVINNHPNQTSRIFTNYVCDYITGSGEIESHLIMTTPSDIEVATRTANASNPNNSLVDLPVFVAELKDFPELFRSAGEELLRQKKYWRRAGAANLEYQFGWAPLLGDLAKLSTFNDHVEKRVQQLTKIRDKGQNKTLKIGSYSNVLQGGRTFQSNHASFSGNITKTTTEVVSGFIRWYPQNNGWPDKSDTAGMRRLARNAILGLTLDAKAAWELIPFSWLVDWCSNVGSYLQSQRNIVPVTHSPVQVMRHKVSEVLSQPVSNSWGHMTPVDCTFETKSRQIVSPSIEAQWPFLNGRQLSILGSLALTSGSSRSVAAR